MGSMSQQQFENFTASTLYCEKCRATMPVRERLLLVLPDREIFDYLCTGCGSSFGEREGTAGDQLMAEGGPWRKRALRETVAAPRAFSSCCSSTCALFLSAQAKSACRRCGRCKNPSTKSLESSPSPINQSGANKKSSRLRLRKR